MFAMTCRRRADPGGGRPALPSVLDLNRCIAGGADGFFGSLCLVTRDGHLCLGNVDLNGGARKSLLKGCADPACAMAAGHIGNVERDDGACGGSRSGGCLMGPVAVPHDKATCERLVRRETRGRKVI